jgi:alpha-L-rhamnosidase
LTDGKRIAAANKVASNQPGNAAVLLRKEIQLDGKVTHATAFLCGLGYSELEVNGRKIGTDVLDPGFTDFSRRVLYRTYDVTDAIRRGPNAFGVILGGGWFNLATGDLFSFQTAPWSASPRLLCQLHIEFADGTSRTVVSDASWKWSTGAIIFNCVRGGETIDAREDKLGWSLAGYDDSTWHGAAVVERPAGKLVSQQHPPIRATASIRSVALTEPKPGVHVFDLGVNIAGWARLTTRGPRGTRIKLQSNELLNQDGTVNTNQNTSHTYGRFQTEEYILKGEGVETFEPRFTYHGFRYVQVTGLTEKPTLDSLTGRWVTTAAEPAGQFTCSNERINKIQELILRTQLNNMHGIPTDCPQREKMGWMDDGCVCMEMAFYNFDTPLFYRKWFHDMMDAQDANGHVADFVPTSGWGRTGPKGELGAMADPWWGGAIVLAPWKLYLHYGDTRVLEEGYSSMKAYVDYLGTTTKNHLIPWGLGDWLVGSAKAGAPPQTHLSTAAYAYQARIVSQAAALLEKEDDARRYAALAAQIRDAFNKKNLNTETGWYVSNSQSGQALPLALHLAPENLRPQVLARLVESITSRQGHVGAGIVGLLPLFLALMDNGRDDLAYTMLTQEDFPGWLHMINSGATSIWEAWNGEASRNHPTLGCIGMWLYQGLGGIRRDPTAPAFKRFLIKPAVVGDLAWAKCSYPSVHGTIESNWRREGEKLRLEVSIPANTTATVYVPTTQPGAVTESGRPAARAAGVKFLRAEKDAAVYEVGSGSYDFAAPFSSGKTPQP